MSRRSLAPYLKKIGTIVVLLLLLFVIRGIIVSIISTHDRSQILKQLQEELSQKKQEQAYLSQKLYYAKTDNFVEEEARRKLGLVREGESVVVDQKIEPARPQPVVIAVPIWKKWWALFF